MGWHAKRGLRMNVGGPTDSASLPEFEGVGDAHSSDDTKDNITLVERRGITHEKVISNKP